MSPGEAVTLVGAHGTMPATATGALLLVVLPLPSWPVRLPPQQ